MSTRYRRAVETRRLYRYESVFSRSLPPETRRARPIAELRNIAAFVWADQQRRGRCPVVTCGAGVPQNGMWLSYYETGRVVLSRGQRTVAVLLHELAHAMRYHTHGPGFVRKYVELLCRYGGCEEGELIIGLGLCKVKT